MPARRTRTIMTAERRSGTPGLYRLLAWLSPSFPIGAFSYSHGREAAVAAGSVHDRATLDNWIAAIVIRGSGRMDTDLLCAAYRAEDEAVFDEANRRCLAFRATAELALESAQQGAAFAATCAAAWCGLRPPTADAAGPSLSRIAGEGPLAHRAQPLFATAGEGGGGPSPEAAERVGHAAAFGRAAARAGIELEDALLGYLHAFAGNLVSAGLRLGIVGQTDGQRILAALETPIAQAATAALTRDPDDFGSATFAADLASMTHETQYSRLFRS